jgi:hypothetical protein
MRVGLATGLIVLAFTTDAVSQEPSRPRPAIALPLSQYGPLTSPALATAKLRPPALGVVQSAIAIAKRASTRAMEAETVMARAKRAADQGRAAALKADDGAPGYGAHIVSFRGQTCRYRGALKAGHATAHGVMVCGAETYAGRFRRDRPDGLIAEEGPDDGYLGQYRNGERNGLGGDYALKAADAYEGEYSKGRRWGLGIERDRDGFYPGRYGFYTGPQGRKTDMELMGLQNFRSSHWAGTYGYYAGPKIACTVIKGAVLEGSVLDGYGAKFDAAGRLVEQGRYRLGVPENGGAPPC